MLFEIFDRHHIVRTAGLLTRVAASALVVIVKTTVNHILKFLDSRCYREIAQWVRC